MPCLRPVLPVFAALLALLAASCTTTSDSGPPRIDEGPGRFLYKDTVSGKSLWAWYYRPAGLTADSPIVFVMHGVRRNANSYRNNWISFAEHHRFLIVAPEFSRDDFPGSWHYNLGNVMHRSDSDGGLASNDRKYWSFLIVDRLFHKVRALTNSRRESFSLFGHSAGGQFVHRYMTFTGGQRVDLAIAANPGWYTMPLRDERFPYGLGGTSISDAQVKTFFAQPMVVLLGEEDTLRTRNLRQTPEADRQGANRLERGKTYFETAKQRAASTGAAFNWRLQTVPGVGHSNSRIAGSAAALIAEAEAKRR